MQLTRSQVAARKDKAERFVRDVIGDGDRADEIAVESVEDYAERKKIRIQNPQRKEGAAMATKQDLLERIHELEQENAELSERLDDIAEIVGVEEEEEEDQGEDDSDED